jgi:hypothetical protein
LCLCKIAIYRVFHCGISMYICIITGIGSSPLFYLSSLLTEISTGLKILYSFLYRK